MQHTIYQGSRPCGFRQDFLRFSHYKQLFCKLCSIGAGLGHYWHRDHNLNTSSWCYKLNITALGHGFRHEDCTKKLSKNDQDFQSFHSKSLGFTSFYFWLSHVFEPVNPPYLEIHFRGQKFHSSTRNYEWNGERMSNSSPSTRPVVLWEELLEEVILHITPLSYLLHTLLMNKCLSLQDKENLSHSSCRTSATLKYFCSLQFIYLPDHVLYWSASSIERWCLGFKHWTFSPHDIQIYWGCVKICHLRWSEGLQKTKIKNLLYYVITLLKDQA